MRSSPNLISVTPATLVLLDIFLSRLVPSSLWPDYFFPNQSAKAMHGFETLFTLFLVTHPIFGTAYIPGKPFSPRKYADVNRVARRDCVPAAPNVTASAVGYHRIHFQQLSMTPLDHCGCMQTEQSDRSHNMLGRDVSAPGRESAFIVCHL